MKLTVVGTGYVGLVSAVCLAHTGLDVVGVDVDRERIAGLAAGRVPIWEPGLAELTRQELDRGRIRFTHDLGEALRGSDAVMIAVGTPPSDDGGADLEQVLAVARTIGRLADHDLVVITKSTVPVGTTGRLRAILREELAARGTSLTVAAVANPEFLREGTAIDDFLRPDRLVVGIDGDAPEAWSVMERIYRPLLLDGRPLVRMDTRSAEITKYAANAMLATRISFMNQIAALCDAVGADVDLVRQGIAGDHRIGPAFLRAGAGYGGSCFPKDIRSLRHQAALVDVPVPLIDAVEEVNAAQRRVPVARLRPLLGCGDRDRLDGRTVAVWGLAFKPDTDDVREAPAVAVIEELLAAGAVVAVHDPVAHVHAAGLFGDRVRVAADPYDATDGADGLILMTEWPELRTPEPARLAARMRGRAVVDARNVLDRAALAAAGFQVVGIGRPLPGPGHGRSPG